MAEENKEMINAKRRHNIITAIILFAIAGLIAFAIVFVPVLKTGSWNDIGVRLIFGFIILFWALILYGNLYQF